MELSDFDGPLGALEPELARRRIAVATDARGQVCLVRPDSIVLEFDDDSFPAVEQLVRDDGLHVLGDELGDDPPASRTLAVRKPPQERPTRRSGRWTTADVRGWAVELESDDYRVRANQVYLGDGVTRQLGRVFERSNGTPGYADRIAMASTVRPAAPPAHLPPALDLAHRERPNVLVLDTGLRTVDAHAEHPWLRDRCVVHQPWRDLATVGRWDDEDEPDDDRRGRLDQQAGHGTFISGILRQLCPDAEVHHRGALTSYGDGDDASVITGIQRAIRDIDARIDVVVMAFGTYATDDEPPPMARAIRRLQPEAVVVASAGNDGTTRRYFPAALPGVIGVGSLDEDGPAAFSNHGSWVDACAPGVDVVSTFFTNVDDHCHCCGALLQEYRGWARWSGTSFSSPKVAGAICQEMYLHGGTARDAWQRLSAPARHRVPDLGVVVNV